MTKVYLSHPYTGDEENNMREANEIRNRLKKKAPFTCFVNPLGLLGSSQDNYCASLADALELLEDCDICVFCGDWEKSTGCIAEKAFCIQQGIPTATLDKFERDVDDMINKRDLEDLKSRLIESGIMPDHFDDDGDEVYDE